MKLAAEQARELTYLPAGHSYSDIPFTVVLNEQVDARRWTSVHRLVVKDADGNYWSTTYELGLTEYQDIQPFEDQDEVTLNQVVKIPVTTYEYKGMGVAE